MADTLCKLGFQLPWKCFCCLNGSCVSIEHVFSMGHIVMEVLSYFGGMCGVTCTGSLL